MTTIDNIAEHFNFGRVMDPRESNVGPYLTTAYLTPIDAGLAVLRELDSRDGWRDTRYHEICLRLDHGETFQFNRLSGDTIYIGRLV